MWWAFNLAIIAILCLVAFSVLTTIELITHSATWWTTVQNLTYSSKQCTVNKLDIALITAIIPKQRYTLPTELLMYVFYNNSLPISFEQALYGQESILSVESEPATFFTVISGQSERADQDCSRFPGCTCCLR